MIFQTLSNTLINVHYVEGQIVENLPNDEIYQTWQYCDTVDKKHNIEYAYLYCNGLSLENAVEGSKKEYIEFKNKVNAHLKALKTCKLNLSVLPWWNYIPKDVLFGYLDIKNKMVEEIFKQYKKPEYYDLLLETQRLISDIKNNTPEFQQPVLYNLFGTITGRLSTRKGSLPILTMRKSERNIIKPSNEHFVSMDFNGLEPRVFLGLLGCDQPTGDFYQWVKKELFDNKKERTEIKKEFISWMYGEYTHNIYDQIFNKKQIIEKYYDGCVVKNIYGKTIPCSAEKAMSYIISSTAAFLFFEQAIKLHKYLKNKKSYIRYLIHDDVVIDKDENEDINKEMLEIYVNTRFGNFSTNVKVGYDFANMERLRLIGEDRWFILL